MESAQYSLISKAEVTTLPPDHNVIQALDPDQLAHFTKPFCDLDILLARVWPLRSVFLFFFGFPFPRRTQLTTSICCAGL